MSEEITRVITREQAEEWDLHYDAPGQISDEDFDKRRWYTWRRVIFTAPDDGLVYAAEYLHPATEMQEVDPWDDKLEVTLTRYESYEKTVTAWRPVKAAESKRDAIDAQTLHDSPGADLDDEAERADVLRTRREMAREAGDDDDPWLESRLAGAE